MNQYGQAAMEHWQTWLPNRFSMLEDPKEFFTILGEQVAEQISQTQMALEQTHRRELDATDDYLTRVGLLNNIRMTSEQMVLAEMVLLEPEPQTQQEPPSQATSPDEPDLSPWMTWDGMPRDRDHRLWAMEEDDAVSVTEFGQARRAWKAHLTEQIRRGEEPTDV